MKTYVSPDCDTSMLAAKLLEITRKVAGFCDYLSRTVKCNRLERSEKDIARWGSHIVGPRKLYNKDVDHRYIQMDR